MHRPLPTQHTARRQGYHEIFILKRDGGIQVLTYSPEVIKEAVYSAMQRHGTIPNRRLQVVLDLVRRQLISEILIAGEKHVHITKLVGNAVRNGANEHEIKLVLTILENLKMIEIDSRQEIVKPIKPMFYSYNLWSALLHVAKRITI